MAEEKQNSESENEKEEQPSERKKQKFKEEGDFPISKEFGSILVLAVFCFIASKTAAYTNSGVYLFQHMISQTHGNLDEAFLKTIFMQLGLFLSIIAILFYLIYSAQTQFTITSKKLQWSFSKLNILNGIKNLFGMQMLINFAKTLMKILVLALGLFLIHQNQLLKVFNNVGIGIQSFAYHFKNLGFPILKTITIYFVLIGLFDYGYMMFKHMKKLKMDKKEMKDEYKETEGDPHVKGKIKSLRREKLKQILEKEVPKADFVVTNPEHYAIAIRWKEKSKSPVVVAKGMDLLAQRIKLIATQNKVPIIRNPPLARNLYAEVKLGAPIKKKHYAAVAKIILYLRNNQL